MTEQQHELIRAQFRAFAGEERYRRFVSIVQGWRPDETHLAWWQERLIEKFAEETGNRLPIDCNALKALFDGELPVQALAEDEVPDWCTIEHLSDGQASGICDGFKWYFSAKYGSWSLAVAIDAAVDPADIDDESGGFFKEAPYGDGRYGASWMPDDEARHFIVESLTEFRELQSRRS